MKQYFSSRIDAIKRNARKLMAVASLAVMIPFAAGCFGSFQLTTAVYDVNENVSESTLVQSMVMWCFAIIPVYPIAVLGDVIIFNTLEFFSGGDTVASTTTLDDGTRITFAPSGDNADTATVTAVRDGETLAEHTLIRSEDSVKIFDADGMLVAKANI